MKKLLLSLFIIFSVQTAKAQLTDWEYGGYVKNLAQYINGSYEGLTFDIGKIRNTFQGRLNIDWYPTDIITISAQSRHVFTYQKNYSLTKEFYSQLSLSSYYFDLTWESIEDKDYSIFSEFDRFNALFTYNNLEITLGRQRIAWGTCLVWNPTDLFNASNILDFDYPEKPGSDAIKVQYYINELSSVECAVTPGKIADDEIYAARFKTNYSNYDISLLAGWQKRTFRAGGTWAGDIAGGGFRGEVVYSKPDINQVLPLDPALAPYLLPGTVFKLILDKPYWTSTLSFDFTFENSLYLHMEWLYNGLGGTKNTGERRTETLYTGELSPARYSLFFETAYDITPLMRADIFFLVNPSDGSWIAAPSMTMSIGTNWELYLLVFPSEGKTGTEFGGFPAQYYFRMQYSF